MKQMDFRTTLPIEPQEPKIDYSSRLLLLGSCFVENIGEKLDHHKLLNLRNPFGILYHPAAIENFIVRSINLQQYSVEDVFFHNERWHCFDAHSQMSNANREELVKDLNLALQETKDYLLNASHLIITLGTSWAYKLLETENLVANCHKLPQRRFQKQLISAEETGKSLENITSKLAALNSRLQVIFTISPVRHIKDGIVQNQMSKANLITAVYKHLQSKRSKYFPAYEIVMDDLRDYRFYAEDMVHPNSTAINYIWEIFKKVWLAETAIPVLEEIAAVQKGLAHRAFNPSSEAHQKFLEQLQVRMENLKIQYPYLKF